ncbi:acyltransferase [Enterococcus hirae]
MSKRIFYLLSKFLISFFFDKQYLEGRWFQYPNLEGYKWCWKAVFLQKILGKNRKIPWPISGQIVVGNKDNIHFDINDLNNFQHYGCYFQNYRGNITLGKGTYIAPNVGIITENHDLLNLDLHQKAQDVVIGEQCWIGMNSVLLPGIILGPKTIVGAGSIVTKSFKEGNCVIAGNPAKVIRKLSSHEEND